MCSLFKKLFVCIFFQPVLIYHFDEKYQCLLISYKLILFQQKQEQQQPVIDFKNGVIVKIYKS